MYAGLLVTKNGAVSIHEIEDPPPVYVQTDKGRVMKRTEAPEKPNPDVLLYEEIT